MITFSSINGFIELPSADLKDSESLDVSVNFMRAMDGARYTHKKTSDRTKFSFTFSNINRLLMFDLQDFLKSNKAEIITITDWDGDRYRGIFEDGSDSFEILNRATKGIDRNESGSITLEFVGVKL